MMRYAVVLVALLGLAGGHADASTPSPAHGAIYAKVAALDARIFDAYNRCDMKTLGSLVADDLEFYHDRDGLSVGKAIFLAKTKANICGKVRRDLVPGTLDVYALGGYGAVELGTHRFSHPGHASEPLGEAKFVMVWQDRGGVWKLTRVISYGHGVMAK